MATATDPRPVPLTLVVAQRQTLIREVLVRLLEESALVRVVAQSNSILAAADAAAVSTPDVVLVDGRCVEDEGASALTLIKRASARTQVVLMVDDVRHDDVATALATGADGLVLKSISVVALCDTIGRLTRRGAAVGPAPVRAAEPHR